MTIKKRAVQIITLTGIIHIQNHFLKLEMLKIEDQLKLQELKFYYKYIHSNLPVYLLNWKIIPNYNIHSHNTRNVQIYLHLGQYMNLQKSS